MGQKSVEMFGLGTPHSPFPLQEVSPTIPQLAGNLHSLLKPQIQKYTTEKLWSF